MLMPTKDDLVTCPYDKVHRISLSRFQVHLVKCKQNYPDTKLIECPINATHKVWEPELNFHLGYVCEDRGKIDNFVSVNTDEMENIIELPKVEIFEDGGENWDDEDHPTYDPEKHCLNNPVIIIKNGLKPSQRKEHRQKQRQKLRNFKLGGSPGNEATSFEGPSTSGASISRPSTSGTSSAGVSSSSISSVKRLPTSKPKTVEGIENIDPSKSNITLSNLSICDRNNIGEAFIKPKIISGRGRGRLLEQQ